MTRDKFQGRHTGQGRLCQTPGCEEPGEFRAPGWRPPDAEGPGEWRWFCLDHVRQFNAAYDWFEGMTPDQILRAQSPIAGWETQVRAFRPDAGVDDAPRWTDYADPLDAISARARGFRGARQQEFESNGRFSAEERKALDALGLPSSADRQALRRRYSELVRRYHPDRNGGDRSMEARLQLVVDAYNLLKKARGFA